MAALLRTDFDAFLFAPVADDANGMPLTLLSVLARSGVDPWAEAADLFNLSRDDAAKKLTALLAGVPNGPSAETGAATLASRLVALLHAAPKAKPKAPAAVGTPQDEAAIPGKLIRLAIYSVLALIALLAGNWVLNNQHESAPADTSVPAGH
jgi:hypothetical protein